MSAEPGHNSGEVNCWHLRSFIERIEALETEIRDRNDDKSSVYQEAKGTGLDTKIMKKIVAERRKDPSKRQEEEVLMDLYKSALGMG